VNGYAIYMLEPKAEDEIGTAEVEAKRRAAVQWCQHASEHSATFGGKPWRYALIPHNAVQSNMSLEGLARTFG
jgi:type III restriction enzyme